MPPVLLKANGSNLGGITELLNLATDEAAEDLIAGKIDAVFMMGRPLRGNHAQDAEHARNKLMKLSPGRCL